MSKPVFIHRFWEIILVIIAAAGCFTGATDGWASSAEKNPPVMDQGYAVVISSGSETLENLARKYYGDVKKAWVISDYNRISTVNRGDVVVIPPENSRLGGLNAHGYQTVPVLAYHRFSVKESEKMMVKQNDFNAQMAYLKNAGFRSLSLKEFAAFLNFREQIPEKSVLITFDDGWKSAYDIALPILQKYGFTATWFIYTDFIGGTKAMNWDQVRRLNDMGFDIQSQSKYHTNLAEQNKNESLKSYILRMEREISLSQKIIERKTGRPCRFMAYPYGATNGLVMVMLKKYNYHGAFTVDRKANPFFVDNFAIHRSLIFGEYDLNRFKRNLTVFHTINQ